MTALQIPAPGIYTLTRWATTWAFVFDASGLVRISAMTDLNHHAQALTLPDRFTGFKDQGPLPTSWGDALTGLLQGKLTLDDIPHRLHASAFATKVLTTLVARVPRGRVCTYGQLALLVGGSQYTRAVARAMATNPLAILYPCHRVVSHEGWGGYAFGLPVKQSLLALEGLDITTPSPLPSHHV